ncbi:MAG: amidohydrolase family protein [Thermoanaerobacterales bacterium]|nr:amidohydrolase family protein [Thermoanaerobacterales bacterium]
MADILIKNGLVLTFEKDTLSGQIIENGAVAVKGNKIIDIGKTDEIEKRYGNFKKVIDANGKIVMPVFIVTHTHMSYVLGHNMPVDYTQLKSFWDMLQKMGWEWLEDITYQEGIYAATKYSASKLLKNGTTTVCELVEGPNALPGALSASAKAIQEVGIRAQVGFEVTERVPGVSILEKLEKQMAEKAFQENIDFLSRYPKGNGGRIEGRLGVHTAYTNSLETLRRAREIADQCKCGIEIHIAEIPRAFLVEKYGKSAPQVLEEAGVLGPDVIAAHCIDLTDEDLDILARNKVNVAHTPMTNSLGGNGVAKVPEMMEKNINVTLGHDCFFTLDISEYIRYAFLVHKAHRANPTLLPSFQVLDMALGNAARAMGLEKQIGSLEVGKKADIIIINPDSPTPVVPASVISYYTMTFQGKHVETVLVDGNIVVENGKMTTVDEEEVKAECIDQAKALWRKNGVNI